MNPAAAVCRVCGAATTAAVGEVEYLQGCRLTVFDCEECGCRFTAHDASVHEAYHRRGTLSYYREYPEIAARCRGYFDAGDAAAFKRELEGTAKYRFVIARLAAEPQSARVLEVGCSRGYLTAYFIMQGRRILGTDISEDAIRSARETFGDHFAVAGSAAVAEQAPFDVIYHVGLIGCVADPLGMTRELLGLLRPGGRLFFNAPNRGALRTPGQLWFDSAPPPDLVTLFPEGFWRRHCSHLATVEEAIEFEPRDRATALAAQRLAGVRWHPPTPQSDAVIGHRWAQPSARPRAWAARLLAKAARISRLSTLVSPKPTEFGMFVSMRVPQ